MRDRHRLGERETRTAEAVTVAWMLALLATGAAETAGLMTRVLLWHAEGIGRLRVQSLSAALLGIAVVAGLVTVGLTPLTLKLRRSAPPRVIVVIALVAGLLPLVTLIVLIL